MLERDREREEGGREALEAGRLVDFAWPVAARSVARLGWTARAEGSVKVTWLKARLTCPIPPIVLSKRG